MRKLIQFAALMLGLLLLFAMLPASAAEEEMIAQNLSKDCKYTADFKLHADRLIDEDFDTVQRVNKGKTITVSWKDSVPVASIYLSFYYAPVDYTVFQYDADNNKLSEEKGILLYNNVIPTLPETRKISIRADADECGFCSLYAYGEGSIPDYHPFEPTVEKADYMTFAMHPDDDVLFLGAVYPICEAEKGLKGVSMIMSTKLPEKIQRQRRQEDLNGAWILGLRTQPVFGGFPDIPQDYYKKFGHTFTKDDVTRYAVAQIRKYKPEIVFTQDLNGEYGHWQHKVLAEGVLAAVPLAANPDYKPKGYPASEPWEVKKLYIHLYHQNKIVLDVNSPIEGLGGMTAFEAAQEAFRCHASQTKKDNHHVSTTEYSIAEFGLAYTTVGNDTPGLNDLFEHIDPETLSVTPAPEKTPEPTPEPTPDPTPTMEPTEQPTVVPTEAPADTPSSHSIVEETKQPAETEPEPTKEAIDPVVPAEPQKNVDALPTGTILLIGGGLVLLLIMLVILLMIVRKRR